MRHSERSKYMLEAWRRDNIRRFLSDTLRSFGCRGDANETLVFARQLEYVVPKMFDVVYAESRGRQILPINMEVPNGAVTHTYTMIDGIGEAVISDMAGDDIPLVELRGTQTNTPIVSILTGFKLDLQEIRQAAMINGMQIDAQKAILARKVAEQKLDQLMGQGDAARNIPGFYTNPNITPMSGLTGDWKDATDPQDIVNDINAIVKQVFDQSEGTWGSEENGKTVTLVVTPAQYSILNNRNMTGFAGQQSPITILQYLKTLNPAIRNVTFWNKGKGAAANSTDDRIVCLPMNPEVVEAIIPQDFEIFPMQQRGLSYIVPAHMRFGGTIIRYPIACVYADGC